MDLVIIPSNNGLKVTFRNLSSKVPPGTTFEWDFGDSTTSDLKSPTHLYQEPGIYLVTTTVKPPEESEIILETVVLVSDKVKTTLSDTIYRLIDGYLPTGIIKTFPFDKKRLYIEKWQLYIHPLVNHEIPTEEYNNEFWYEALENQLVMEAAILDFLTITFMNYLQSVSVVESDEETSAGDEEGVVKKIVTGPSEVEFFNPLETDKEIVASITKAIQPGGFIDTLRLNLCTLSERLDIYLPFCEQKYTNAVVPKVVNRRKPVKYQGPNPTYPIKN